MSGFSTSEIISLMDSARFDAAGQIRNVIRRYNEIVDGNHRLVDPSNPLSFLMEMACAGAANSSIHHESEMRRRHPMLAQIKEDLYYHLTDRQYVGIFAIPSETFVSMILPLEDIESNAVPLGNTGVRVLTLGKNTVFRVGMFEFTLEHPIDFKITPGGGLTVGFGTPSIGALHPLNSNIIVSDPVNYQGYEAIRFSFPCKQQTISSEILRINRATSSVGNISYTDKYHYLRAFVRRTENGVRVWKEIRTTHSEHTYDPMVPTLLVRDLDGELKLTLPVVYHTMNMIGDEIRVMVYTTKAQNDVILSEFTENQWSIEPRDFDNTDNGTYTAPFQRMNTAVVFSSDYTRGGREELSFEELRERITEVHYGAVDIPITNVNREMKLADKGFNSVKAIDGITSRAYNATRTMPLPVDSYLVSPINVGVFNLMFRPADLEGVDGVTSFGDITTIHPKVLFKEINGTVTVVGNDERQMIDGLTGDLKARHISMGNYMFTPFYNVLDAGTTNFQLRTYHMDAPTINGRQFVRDNPSLLMDLYTSQGVTLERTQDGYVINLLTSSGSVYKELRDDQVGVQLSYVPTGETTHVVMLGELVQVDEDGNRLWSFTIDTLLDINANDELGVQNFISFGNGETFNTMPLKLDFDVCYYVNDYPVQGVQRTAIDTVISQQVVPAGTIGILQEKLEVTIGERLTNLWTGARPIVLPEDYEVYDHDMPMVHNKPVYRRDENNELLVTSVDGVLTVEILHEVGSPVLDEMTELPLYHYRRGEVVMQDGVPVIRNPRTLTRQLDLVLFDGLFYFANDRSSINYVDYVRRNIVQWSKDDMDDMNRSALEETVVKFRPMSTIGTIECVVGEGGDVVMDARQAITVDLLMPEDDWKNESLKAGLRRQVIRVVNEEFSKTHIASKNIIAALERTIPNSVLGIDIKGLGGESNFPLVSLKDGSGQPSIRMKLIALPNDEFTVEEDINVNFIPHLPARSMR